MKAKHKRRLDKKLHKYWLSLGVVDASLVSAWRRKLFDANEFDEFSIDSDNCDELWSDTVAALKKYQLSYRVARVPNSEAESWLSDGGMVVFKFWATKYPSVKIFSGNNPDIR
jgi:hypothetical protein